MGDKPHVRLVDPHAKGDGGNDDDAVLAQKPFLVCCPRVGRQAGVVGHGIKTGIAKPLSRSLDLLARQAVHHPGLIGMLLLQKAQQLLLGIAALAHPVADIGPVKAGDKPGRVAQGQPLHNLVARGDIGRRGQRHTGHARKTLGQRRQAQILGPEVMPPLRHAMGLVDGDQRQWRLSEQVQRTRQHQPLRRHVQQIQLAGPEPGFDLGGLLVIQRGIEIRRPDPQLA